MRGEMGQDFQPGMLPPEMLDEMDGVGPSHTQKVRKKSSFDLDSAFN